MNKNMTTKNEKDSRHYTTINNKEAFEQDNKSFEDKTIS